MALPKVFPATYSFLNPRTIAPKPIALKPIAAILVLAVCAFAAGARAQSADRVPQSFDPTPTAALEGNHPQWASPANDVGAIDPNKAFDNVTLVLARSLEQQKAFDQLVEDQRNPMSPQYHRWLTPNEIGARFGVSDRDISQISGWLESQGLHVNLVSPTRVFISFGGQAASLERAFGAQLHNYKVNGEDRFSVVSEPMIPSALAPVILSVRGLSTSSERPQHVSRVAHLEKPDLTLGAGEYFVTPADFATIYDVPSSLTGAGTTIGIVGEARVASNDISDFESLLGTTMGTPTEVVPSAYGGVDPGAAYTSEPSCYSAGTCSSSENSYIGAQGEATLDETRSGTIAPGASILLVTASAASGGIFDDAEYLTETTPVPAQIMSISFGGCEAVDASSVGDWSTLFENGASEGISIFVSSGDSGAAGCDSDGVAPPETAGVVSPNSICSPIYETCVGGTEFNDASDYSAYWSNSNGPGYESALGYIPEGAWNDPGNSTSGFEVESSGGGVSSVVGTPTWQTGTGVPSARAGRYTPDVAFTASAAHDGYFACLAAIGGDCGNGYFAVFGGTSASAPDMAGVTSLLDQKLGAAQGNIAPTIYSMAASYPAAFHDVTVASSGVASCSVSTPSMCNNSIPASGSLTGGTQGYAVQTGYDEVTGWGSLNVNTFIQDYSVPSGTPATLNSPTPGTMLAGSTVTFSWTTQTGATGYALRLGTTAGASNVYGTGLITATSATPTGLPTNGETIYATLFTEYGSTQVSNSYTFTAFSYTPAALTSPTSGSALTGTSETFTWTMQTGATGYALRLGTTAGASNVYGSGLITATSATPTGLPTNGETIYATLFTEYGATQVSNSYTFKAFSYTPAVLTSPTSGSALTGTSETFTWSTQTGATGYALRLGTTAGASNVYGSGLITATSATPTGLPTNGETIYATLFTEYGSTQVSNSYTFTAFSYTPAVLTSPTSGSALTGTSETFTWTTQTGATGYALRLGTTAGASNVYGSGLITATSATPTGLPTNGETIYATLITEYGANQVSNSYTFTAFTNSPAVLTSPTSGSELTGASETFTWSTQTGATGYALRLGTTAGASNLYGSGLITATSATPTGLPINGETIYATLITEYGATQVSNSYTFTAFTNSPSILMSPTSGSARTGTNATFNLSAAKRATGYTIRRGTTAGD